METNFLSAWNDPIYCNITKLTKLREYLLIVSHILNSRIWEHFEFDFVNIQTGNTMISFHRLKLDKSFIAVWLKNFNTEDRRGSENNMEVTEWDKTNENMPSLSRLFPE